MLELLISGAMLWPMVYMVCLAILLVRNFFLEFWDATRFWMNPSKFMRQILEEELELELKKKHGGGSSRDDDSQ